MFSIISSHISTVKGDSISNLDTLNFLAHRSGAPSYSMVHETAVWYSTVQYPTTHLLYPHHSTVPSQLTLVQYSKIIIRYPKSSHLTPGNSAITMICILPTTTKSYPTLPRVRYIASSLAGQAWSSVSCGRVWYTRVQYDLPQYSMVQYSTG